MAPATKAEILSILEALNMRYWSPDYTREEAKEIARQDCEDYREMPADLLQDACAAWRRRPDSKWAPKTGELLAICAPMLQRRRDAREAMRRLHQALVGTKALADNPALASDEQWADLLAKARAAAAKDGPESILSE